MLEFVVALGTCDSLGTCGRAGHGWLPWVLVVASNETLSLGTLCWLGDGLVAAWSMATYTGDTHRDPPWLRKRSPSFDALVAVPWSCGKMRTR